MSTSNMLSTPTAIAVSAAPEMTICIAFEAAQPPLDEMAWHDSHHAALPWWPGPLCDRRRDCAKENRHPAPQPPLARNVACAGTLAAQCPIACDIVTSRQQSPHEQTVNHAVTDRRCVNSVRLTTPFPIMPMTLMLAVCSSTTLTLAIPKFFAQARRLRFACVVQMHCCMLQNKQRVKSGPGKVPSPPLPSARAPRDVGPMVHTRVCAKSIISHAVPRCSPLMITSSTAVIAGTLFKL